MTDWAARSTLGLPPHGAYYAIRRPPRALATHWIGTKIDATSHAKCVSTIIGIVRNEMLNEGFVDGAYNWFFCNHGIVVIIRGLNVESGANGKGENSRGEDVNHDYYAACWVGGPGDPPPNDAALRALSDIRLKCAEYHAADVPLTTHGYVRPGPTACPGPELTAWVQSHPHGLDEEDDMFTDDDRARLERIEAAINTDLKVDTANRADMKTMYATFVGYFKKLFAKLGIS